MHPDPAATKRDFRFALLLLCFFLSGLAALIYQTAWARLFAFVFGTSELAVASVLAAYMGGLAAGAAIIARAAPRIKRPVLVYGLLELGIAAAAAAVPQGVAAAQSLYVVVFGSQSAPADEGGLLTALFYLACSFLILLLPTGLMGATLPLLARYAVRNDRQVGSRVGLLYSVNTGGAVTGTLLAAFVLLPTVGLARTVWFAIASNALVFGAAALLARKTPELAVAEASRSPVITGERASWILPLIAISGAASFSYEVLWTRLLGHVLGGSVYAFATMLATFLAGIAAGSWLASGRVVRTRESAAAGFAWTQVGVAVCSLGAYLAIDSTPDWIRAVGARADLRLLVDALVAAAILLPGTLCIGATFPMAVRVLARSEHDASTASARVYTWNTVGAIVGAIGAGFFLIPGVGFAASLSVAVTTNVALAATAALLAPGRAWRTFAAAGAALLALLVIRPGPPWSLLRVGTLNLQHTQGEVIYHAVGRSSTVLLRRAGIAWRLSSNGLPEAVVQPPGTPVGRFLVARWLGSLPTWGRPEARSMFVVGLGGGLVVEAVPPSIERIEVVEIEREMIRANRLIADQRRIDPLSDPRVRITVNDARSALLLTRERFDAIVSQPSHPWTASASHLYTKEFFELTKSHLSEDGVFVQWMGVGFVDEPLLKTLVATLRDVFPYVQVYQPALGGLLFTGALLPFEPERTLPQAERPGENLQLFSELGIYSPADVAAHLVLDIAGARDFSMGAPINTDDRNLLQTRSPAVTRSGMRLNAASVLRPFDPLAKPELPWNRIHLVRRMLSSGFRQRARRLAAATPDPADRHVGLGLVARDSGQIPEANRHFIRGLELQPTSAEARAALLEFHHAQASDASRRELLRLSAAAAAPQMTVIEGWNFEREAHWAELRGLEARLSAIPANDPSFAPAGRLRCAWRLADGDPELAAEALQILDGMISYARSLGDLTLRARAAAQAGYLTGALASIAELNRLAGNMHRSSLREALEVVRRLPRNAETSKIRAGLVAALRARVLGPMTARRSTRDSSLPAPRAVPKDFAS